MSNKFKQTKLSVKKGKKPAQLDNEDQDYSSSNEDEEQEILRLRKTSLNSKVLGRGHGLSN